jgi:hypothetical protein
MFSGVENCWRNPPADRDVLASIKLGSRSTITMRRPWNEASMLRQ